MTFRDTAQHDELLKQKTLVLSPAVLNGFNYKSCVPKRFQKDYNIAISTHSERYFFLADLFHRAVKIPAFTVEQILDFIKETVGISATIKVFDSEGNEQKVSGRWEWDDATTKSSCTIYVNGNDTFERQRFTIVHEIIHAIQDLDPEFRDIVGTLPEPIRLQFIERIANKTAAYFLAPNTLVKTYRGNGLSDKEIAKQLQVSEQVVSYA